MLKGLFLNRYRDNRQTLCWLPSLFTAFLLHCSMHSASVAAAIDVSQNGSPAIVRLSGPIEAGDFDKFSAAANELRDAVVQLDSPGGLVREGIKIGQLIRAREFSTVVPNGKLCASACGYIWLAGKIRSVESAANVGFHAAYLADGKQTISSTGNALIGAYLAELGFKELVVIYTTEAAPREMRWLTPKDASYLGLKVSWGTSRPVDQSSVALTREEVRRALLADKWGRTISDRFPEFFAFLIESQLKAQQNGVESEVEIGREILVGPASQKYTDQLLSEARDEVIIGVTRASLNLGRRLLKLNPKICAGLAKPDVFTLDANQYMELAEGKLAPEFGAISHFMNLALLEPPLKQRRLTKRERASVEKRLEKGFQKISPRLWRQFTTREMKLIMSKSKPVRGRDEALFCRAENAMLEALLKYPDVLMLALRHPDIFSSGSTNKDQK